MVGVGGLSVRQANHFSLHLTPQRADVVPSIKPLSATFNRHSHHCSWLPSIHFTSPALPSNGFRPETRCQHSPRAKLSYVLTLLRNPRTRKHLPFWPSTWLLKSYFAKYGRTKTFVQKKKRSELKLLSWIENRIAVISAKNTSANAASANP